jgi:hypothetical protein
MSLTRTTTLSEKLRQHKKLVVATIFVVTYFLMGTVLVYGSGGTYFWGGLWYKRPWKNILYEIITWPKYIKTIIGMLSH